MEEVFMFFIFYLKVKQLSEDGQYTELHEHDQLNKQRTEKNTFVGG